MQRLTKILAFIALLALGTSFTAAQDNVQWSAEYFDNAYLGGDPVLTNTTDDIAFAWGYGSPAPEIGPDTFSARWTTEVNLTGGTYRFYVNADDNINITLDYGNTLLSTFGTNQVGELNSGDITLPAGDHVIQVNYRELSERAYAYVSWERIDDGAQGPGFAAPETVNMSGNLWSASYYDGQTPDTNPVENSVVDTLSADWGAGAPVPELSGNDWSATFTNTQSLDGGEYQLRVNADDGVRVYIDGDLVLNEWHAATTETYTTNLTLANGTHDFEVQYYEDTGQAFLRYDFVRINDRMDDDLPTDAQRAVATRAPLMVREVPNSINGNIVGTINQGNVFYVLDSYDENWDIVRYNGVVGYAYADYIQPIDDDTPTEQPPVPVTAELIAPVYNVNIRAEPGIEFNDVGTLPPDRPVQVIGRNPSNTWYKIDYNGIRGWVTAEYTRLTPATDLGAIPVTET